MSVKTQSYAASNIGRVRKSNQDSGYAGYNFFFVADGMGGHAGGDIASAIIAQSVAQADREYEDTDQASSQVVEALLEANQKLADTVSEHAELKGMGTTFSGIVFTGDLVTVTHIGDSRVYMVSEDKVSQVTKDHTFVQRLVDTGRITAEEALTHPRRSVLMRVLGDVEVSPEIDTEVFKAAAGDRWMLCSDGLCGVVPDEIINKILLDKSVDAEEATALLIYEALEHGAPDNVTVVVVDVISSAVQSDFVVQPTFVGSAENEVVISTRRGSRLVEIFNPRILRDLLVRQPAEEFAVETEELLERIMKETRSKVRWRRIRGLAIIMTLIGVAGYLAFSAYAYTQTRFFIAENNGYVVIYQGIRESFGPFVFSREYQRTDIVVSELNTYQQQLVERSISGDSFADISEKLSILREVGK
jgi:serine/threonine protein phosphatase PrpC